MDLELLRTFRTFKLISSNFATMQCTYIPGRVAYIVCTRAVPRYAPRPAPGVVVLIYADVSARALGGPVVDDGARRHPVSHRDRAQATRGGLGAVPERVRLPHRPPHGAQTREQLSLSSPSNYSDQDMDVSYEYSSRS